MKFLLVLALALAGVIAMPYGNDNPEYAMVPDGFGNFKLVNIHEDPEPESFFDPAADTVFKLFTRLNGEAEILDLSESRVLEESTFNAANPVRILVHGWQSNAGAAINTLVRDAYLSLNRGFNVIVVDWSAGAETINYIAARNRVGGVGAVVAQLIRQINQVYPSVMPRDIVVVGHSLGAHIAGFTGKSLLGDMRLGAVMALDAALPLFSIDRPAERVNTGDATYVESMHTNGGLLGFDQPLGHANFYPNGGASQPGCGIDVAGSCAHSRAVDYFAESITTDRHFWGRQCANWEQAFNSTCVASGIDRKMGGEPIETLALGDYWLTTNRASPFATGI